jgi:DNA-binding MurR/RpiR family transcriptional regulator
MMALFEGVRLTPTQRRIAQCLIEHAGEAAYLTSSELADLAQVSQPSVTRFAVAMGYDGYPEMRRALRAFTVSAVPETIHEARRNEWQGAVADDISHLTTLTDVLGEPAMIDRVGQLAMNSTPLLVLGLRASAPLAQYFGYFAAKIHPDVRVLNQGDSRLADLIDRARDAGAASMVAFVMPRYPREAIDALAYARACGLSVATVTDSPMSPAAGESDVMLFAGVGSRLVFDSHAGPMVLASLLLQAMCDAQPAVTQHRLEQFESSALERQLFIS